MERDILNCLCMISNYAEMIPGTGLFCCNLTLKNWTELNSQEGLPRWLSGKESTCDAGDSGLIPGSERSPGVGNGNPLQYSCLGNPMDRGVWWATSPWGHKSVGRDWETKTTMTLRRILTHPCSSWRVFLTQAPSCGYSSSLTFFPL